MQSRSASTHASHSSEECSARRTTTTSSLDLFASSGELSGLSSVTKPNACSDSVSTGCRESSAIFGQESEAKSAEPAHLVGRESEVHGSRGSDPNHCCAEEKLFTRTASKVGGGVHCPIGKRCRLAAQSGEQYPIEFSMCKWSPDGKMLLTSGLSSHTYLYHLPTELESGIPRKVLQLTYARVLRHGEPLQDACWLPRSPGLFASCCQDHPVQLWDSSTGNVTAAYKTYHRKTKVGGRTEYTTSYCSYLYPTCIQGKLVSPHCIAFSEDGQSLYCGVDGHLKVFATERPGASGRIWRISGMWVVSLITSMYAS